MDNILVLRYPYLDNKNNNKIMEINYENFGRVSL
jgi:hypothetical protein